MNKTTFIHLFPDEIQRDIKNELREKVSEEEFEAAIASRLCDLEDTINIAKYV